MHSLSEILKIGKALYKKRQLRGHSRSSLTPSLPRGSKHPKRFVLCIKIFISAFDIFAKPFFQQFCILTFKMFFFKKKKNIHITGWENFCLQNLYCPFSSRRTQPLSLANLRSGNKSSLKKRHVLTNYSGSMQQNCRW